MSQTSGPDAEGQEGSLPTPSIGRHWHLPGIDGRVLCDRFAHSALTPVEEGDASPHVCGSCVMVAEELHARAKGLIYRLGQPQPSPADALEQLRRTRWDGYIRLDDVIAETERINYRYPWFSEDQDLPEGAHRVSRDS